MNINMPSYFIVVVTMSKRDRSDLKQRFHGDKIPYESFDPRPYHFVSCGNPQ